MANFIEVGNQLINVEEIGRVEFLGDDLYLGLFPKDENGEIQIDFIPFTFGKIYLKDGQVIEVEMDLYPPEEADSEVWWIQKNRTFINLSMRALKDAIGEITKIDGFEYKFE